MSSLLPGRVNGPQTRLESLTWSKCKHTFKHNVLVLGYIQACTRKPSSARSPLHIQRHKSSGVTGMLLAPYDENNGTCMHRTHKYMHTQIHSFTMYQTVLQNTQEKGNRAGQGRAE